MKTQANKTISKAFVIVLAVLLLLSYVGTVTLYSPLRVMVGGAGLPLPLPDLYSPPVKKETVPSMTMVLQPQLEALLQREVANRKAAVRQAKIDRVESFFSRYGSPLVGYGYIFVDQAEACGGDYRVLVGIAGSESGLGRIMYKRYNPFGYLNNVQYPDLETALTTLACRVSRQHISVCGLDLNCLADRYAGPQDDLEHFKSKVRWFINQV